MTPAVPRTDLLADPTPQPGVCLTADTMDQLRPAPAELTGGKILVYEPLEDGNSWGLVLHNLDGSEKRVVTSTGNWGALSPDGKKVAYSGLDNSIHIVDLDLQTDQILPNAYGFDLHWSPDGTQIAFVYLNGSIIDSVFIMDADGTALRQLSNLSYESVVGWSPDGSLVYFVAPFTGGAAWKVYSFELASAVVHELFTIENGTPKFLNPKLSPDGTWIAYRGKDNSSLYLVHPDGSDMHLVLDNIGVVGIEWSNTGWLGVSLSDQNSTTSTIVLIKPDNCEGYKVPFTVQGDLEGLFIP
jgi:Tol biopolymer transport system component